MLPASVFAAHAEIHERAGRTSAVSGKAMRIKLNLWGCPVPWQLCCIVPFVVMHLTGLSVVWAAGSEGQSRALLISEDISVMNLSHHIDGFCPRYQLIRIICGNAGNPVWPNNPRCLGIKREVGSVDRLFKRRKMTQRMRCHEDGDLVPYIARRSASKISDAQLNRAHYIAAWQLSQVARVDSDVSAQLPLSSCLSAGYQVPRGEIQEDCGQEQEPSERRNRVGEKSAPPILVWFVTAILGAFSINRMCAAGRRVLGFGFLSLLIFLLFFGGIPMLWRVL